MTLPVGEISLSQVNTELSTPSTSLISLDQTNVRSLASVPSGTISMSNLQGKSSQFVATISSDQINLDLYTWATGAGYPGSGAAQITVAPGIYVYSTNTGTNALTIPASFGAGNLTLVNNGYIMGMGGSGGSVGPSPGVQTAPGGAGGNAMSISTPIILTNNSYIAGGGGAGGSAAASSGQGGGGGGAGGGSGATIGPATSVGGAGGAVGASGSNGSGPLGSGGGGGRVLPGTGGAGGTVAAATPTANAVGNGGGSGGGGGAGRTTLGPTPVSPGFKAAGGMGGGGGGWGAAGGAGIAGSWTVPGGLPTIPGAQGGPGGTANAAGTSGSWSGPTTGTAPGGAGGKAINLNGNSITYPAVGTLYGAVS
jgi:hypothetical protein